jgi:hypothetical protein
MPQITEDQQLAAASWSVSAKLQAFHDGLTPDEQRALDIALRRVGARADGTTEDATGYIIPVGALPLIVVKIVEQLQQQRGSTQQPSQGAQRR